MLNIEKLFDQMDKWRNLPNYQLERRADLFFSLYLSDVIKQKLNGKEFIDNFIPEFPVRIGTIYPHIKTDKSYKIDYVGISQDEKTAVLVELKTENLSRRDSQDKYLISSRDIGFSNLIAGIIKIFKATTYKKKYLHLLMHLESLNLISIPAEMNDLLTADNLRGISSLVDQIEITSKVEEVIIIYIQPNGSGEDIISFKDFQYEVKKNDDIVSQRFAKSLLEWAKYPAGTFR